MINVLFLINHAGKAGTETYVRSLARRLPAGGVTSSLCYNEPGMLVGWMKEMGLKTFQMEMRNPFDIIAAIKLARYCRANKIDIIHAQYLRENYIAMISKILNPRVKVFYTSHFIMHNPVPIRFFNRVMSGLQSQVISVSEIGRKPLISNGYDPRKIEAIFNGVDLSIWSGRGDSTLRSELGIRNDEFVLFCGSRFAHDKGHKYLLNAAALLKQKAGGRFVLVLSSDGPLLEDVKQQAKGLKLDGDVIFIGSRKDMKNVYDGADVYINSSEHENLSFAIIEALAEGLPVIATNMGGNPDIINDETGCGLLVEYGDAPELAEAIYRLMNDPGLRDRLRERGAEAVRDKFNLDKMVGRTYNLYVKTTEGHKL